jgi:hypothetical protein
VLRERPPLVVVALVQHLGVDPVAHLAPPLDGSVVPALLDGAHGAVECRPHMTREWVK